MDRKSFLKTAGVGAALTLAGGELIARSAQQQAPPPLPLSLVKDFVIAGHGNFDKVKSMHLETPNLIYTKFDWGNGDYEAAIEGAGHVGDKEIANYLLEAGSRVTIYVLTMLGKTDLVKPILQTYPNLMTAKGPHGFTLLHHAKVGGKDAEELYAWLQEKGMKDDWVKLQ
jgi:hypothetical protein